jgi:hypothetical protein
MRSMKPSIISNKAKSECVIVAAIFSQAFLKAQAFCRS